jgi:hypothetical protein
MTQIQLRQESFSIDYQNESLPALFNKQSSDCDFSLSTALDLMNSIELISIISKSRQTLLIACDQIKDTGLIQVLKQKADSGVRIYLLLGDTKANKMAIDTLSGRCLVRAGVYQKGAMILVDHATTKPHGLLLMDSAALTTLDEKAWAVQLEPQQIDDSFRSFCKLFWEDSDDEYQQQNQQQKKVIHPDGNIVTNHSHQLAGTLKDCLEETLNSLVASSSQAFEVEGRSYRLLLGSDALNISQLARKGVALTDSHIPALLMSNDGNWLLPDSPDFTIANWCLKLSDAQSERITVTYDRAIEGAAWQYLPDVTIGELANKQALRFVDRPDLVRIIEQRRSHTLQAIYTETIESFLSDSAESLAASATDWQCDLMAHQIDYQITIHPPYCPTTAIKDTLYSQWKQAELDWQERLTSLEDQQKEIDEKQSGIAERLSGFLKGFLLGQGQSVKQLNQTLEALKGWAVTEASPAERELQRKQLEELQTRVSQRSKDTVEKLHEAEENQRWQEKLASINKVLDEKKAMLESQTFSQQQLEGKKQESQRQVESEFLVVWGKAVEGLQDKQLELARPTRESLLAMDLEQAEQWKGSLKSNTWKKHYSAFDKALEKRRLALQKIARDIEGAEKAVNGSRLELEQAQLTLNTHGNKFIYQPKSEAKAFDKQLGLKNKANQFGTFTWPDEELPAEGIELRNTNKQRYLVILKTDLLEQAHADAERLNAIIVCDKESINA